MMRTSSAILLVMTLVAAVGCKGKEVTKPDPQTVTELEDCKRQKVEKDKLITQLQAENARLQVKPTTGGQVVIAIEGKILTVKPGLPGTVAPINDKEATAAAREFIDVVEKSRGAIQKCYEQALKKNTGLQSKPVTVTVSATFSLGGAYETSSFAPSLGDTFDSCIKTVASKWALSQKSPTRTFMAPVSLQPS